jgi:hypothetical protein
MKHAEDTSGDGDPNKRMAIVRRVVVRCTITIITTSTSTTRQQTADSRRQTADTRQQTADSEQKQSKHTSVDLNRMEG